MFERRQGQVLFASILAATLHLALTKGDGEFVPNHQDAVPTFLIIGTAKGGTTDLFEQLTATAVNQAPGRHDPPLPHKPLKEPGLLSRGGVDAGKMLPQRSQHVEYLQLLRHPCSNYTAADFQDCLAAYAGKQLTIDATPNYFFSAVAPLFLREMSSLSKVIMMMRDPVERAEALYRHFVLVEGRWSNTTIDQLAIGFFTALRTQPGVASALQRAANCSPSDVQCQANSWRDISGLSLMDFMEHKLFAGGLYRYALAVWRYHYFRPGRVMLVDSHTYFERRAEVMEEVIRFLYGRPMLDEERMQATSSTIWRKKEVPQLPNFSLSPPLRKQLAEFYQVHVMRGLFAMLEDMRAEGAWVVGFDGAPWRSCTGFTRFNARRRGIYNA